MPVIYPPDAGETKNADPETIIGPPEAGEMKNTCSKTIANIATALCKAQATIEGASKDAVNPHFQRRYADLASVWEACRKALTDNGISVVQIPSVLPLGEETSPLVRVQTILLHSSGEWIQGSLSLIPERPGPQAVGACITYGRRYGLSSLVGVCPEDDDAESATRRDLPPGISSAAGVLAALEGRRPQAPKAGEPTVESNAVMRMGFASCKGKLSSEIEDEDLAWYIKIYGENLSDPAKAPFRKSNQASLDLLLNEQASRARAKKADQRPAAPTTQEQADGEIPF